LIHYKERIEFKREEGKLRGQFRKKASI
jgi:hypothetical protein